MTNSPQTYPGCFPGNQMTISDPGELKARLQTGTLFENSLADKPERKKNGAKENSATTREDGIEKGSFQTVRLESPLWSAKEDLIILTFFFFSLGPHPWHMEVPRLGVELELELLVCTTATATWDLRSICDPHHSSWQCRIPNPLGEARDRTCVS